MIRITFIYIILIGTLNGNIIVTELRNDAQVYVTPTSITYVFE